MIDEDAHEVVVLISARIAVRKCGTLGVDCRVFRKPCLVHTHRRRVAPASGDCLVHGVFFNWPQVGALTFF